MIRLLIELGIRRGELFGIMLDDCDVAGPRGYVTIIGVDMSTTHGRVRGWPRSTAARSWS